MFAQAGDQPTRFVRVSVLPASLKGTSSIRYVDPEDAARPKDQSYRGYIDQVIGQPAPLTSAAGLSILQIAAPSKRA